MPQYLKVEGHANLIRDTATGAILNNSTNEYNEYLNRLKKTKIREDEISQHTKDINTINNELSDIKKLLQQLLSVNKDKQGN